MSSSMWWFLCSALLIAHPSIGQKVPLAITLWEALLCCIYVALNAQYYISITVLWWHFVKICVLNYTFLPKKINNTALYCHRGKGSSVVHVVWVGGCGCKEDWSCFLCFLDQQVTVFCTVVECFAENGVRDHLTWLTASMLFVQSWS